MTTPSLDLLQVFSAVAEQRSFTKAAKKLGRDKSQVSRLVRSLEQQLGAALLLRTTRAVELTAEGEALLGQVAPHLAALASAVASVPDRDAAPSGEVVLTSTPDLGRAVLAPLLVTFRARHRLVSVRLLLSNEVQAIGAAGVELAVRVGKPGGNSVVARRVGELSAGFFAAPGYLERRGVPRRVEELSKHDGLWPVPPRGQRAFGPGALSGRPALECADFGLLAEVARCGGGVALLPTFLAARDLAAGALVRVLPEVLFGGAPLYLVSRPPRELPGRVAALRSHLLEGLLRLGRAS